MSAGEQYGRGSGLFRYRRREGALEEVPRLKVVFEYRCVVFSSSGSLILSSGDFIWFDRHFVKDSLW